MNILQIIYYKFTTRNISCFFLYGFETWSLSLKEERRLIMFENRVLRRMFVSNRDEVTGEWRKLHNMELIPFGAVIIFF